MSIKQTNLEASGGVENAELTAFAVVERLKAAWECKSDAELARQLQTTRANVSRWKTRNSIPYAEAVYTSIETEVSLDYLLTGKKPQDEGPSDPNFIFTLDEELISHIMYNNYRLGIIRFIADDDPKEMSALIARSFIHQYDRTYQFIKTVIEKSNLSPEAARRAALDGFEKLILDPALSDD